MDPRWLTVWHRLILQAWRWHYRISRWAYVLILLAGATYLVLVPRDVLDWRAGVAGVAILVSVAGLVRWRIESHPLPTIAVPLFAVPRKEQRGIAEETQRIIVTTLRDKVGPPFQWRILPVPDVVGSSENGFARKLRARLRAVHLIYGDIRIQPTGQRHVYSRLLNPAEESVHHWDTFTGDTTPQRGAFRELAHRLTPSTHVDDVEYPFDFATELEAVLVGLEGRLMMVLGLGTKAEQTLRGALALGNDSESHAIDSVRVTLFQLLLQMGKEEQAAEMLRVRAQSESASPELLRELARHLILRANRVRSKDLLEPIGLLRRAADSKGDPHRETTIYNLANQLNQNATTQAEARSLLALLVSTRGTYSRLWYVKRSMGVLYWERAVEHHDQGHHGEERKSKALAARWYGRAIRARPRYWLDRTGPRKWQHRVRTIHRVPKMYANVADAHAGAHHRIRALYNGWRAARLKRNALRKAWVAYQLAEDEKAIQFFSYAVVGARDDSEIIALVALADLEERAGHIEQAKHTRRRARHLDAKRADEISAHLKRVRL